MENTSSNPPPMSRKTSKKCSRKQKRCEHRLSRDLNIKCSTNPSENLVICNAGLVTGFKREQLTQILQKFCENYRIIMPIGKSYCFVQFQNESDAEKVYREVHGTQVESQNVPLYLTFSETIPEEEGNDHKLPEGLILIPNFITEQQEEMLLKTLVWDDEIKLKSELKHRKVKHFGYEFRYSNNKVDVDDPIAPIPREYHFLQDLFQENGCGNYFYDQLTINHYLPGQGIPPHIDTHSVFEDPILSISLGSTCTMDFKRADKKTSVVLPGRSLLIMSGESRYAWTHGIVPRHNDIIVADNDQGISTQERGTRVSFTFRKVRRGDCTCKYPEFCDSPRTNAPFSASNLEEAYVHNVYEEISNHFDETRHKQWPNVTKFLNTIEPGSILLDVGCGNGKYLANQPGIIKIGCDRSLSLANICRTKSYQVLLADCLILPFRSNSIDAAISIAVIHHLSTPERRRDAFIEIIRVLRPGGKALVYVWAKEQQRNSTNSTYLSTNSNKNPIDEVNKNFKELFEGFKLPVHQNRTNFSESDVLVPWKRKQGGEFLRYYHVFEEYEFVNLCKQLPETKILDIYYDQGNWCTIFQKI